MKKSITQTVIDAHADFFERHRSLVLFLVAILTLASIYGVTQLQFDDDIVGLLVSREERDTSTGEDVGARTDRGILVMLAAEDMFTPESLRVIEQTSQELKQLDGVVGVVSLYDLRTPKRVGRRRTFARVVPPPDAEIERIEKARQLVMEHPMAREQLISADGKETLIALEVDPRLTTTALLAPMVEDIKQVIASTSKGTSVSAMVTGVPAIRIEMARATARDEIIFNIVGPLLAILISYVIFRRVASVAIVLAGAVLGVVWTIGILGLLGISINPVNAVIAPLALAIGLTDSVHMLMHIRDERGKGAEPLHAAVSTIRLVGFPSALTSLTSAIGFASLGIAELNVLAEFGLCSALAVVLAFLSVMTVVPLLGSSVLGNFIQLPREEKQAPDKTKWHTHLVTFCVDHCVATMIASVLVTAWALYLASQLETDPRVGNGLPTSGPTRAAFQLIDENFGGALPVVATVRWDSDAGVTAEQVYDAVAAAHEVLAGEEILGPPLSIVNMYQSMAEKDQNTKSLFQYLAKIPREQLNNIFDRDRRRALVLARCEDAGGEPVFDMLENVQRQFADLEVSHPGFHFGVPDSAVKGIANSTFIMDDLAMSLFMAVPVTLGVLMLALQSIKAGAIAFLPNVFPMAALAATLVLTGQSVTLTGAAVFVMCFGIAVDDTIHAIAGFSRRYRSGESVRDAIVNAYRDLGDAVISTTVILLGGIGVVMLGQSYTTRSFGMVFCIGLLWAIVGDLVILPAVLACWPHRRKKSPDALNPPEATTTEGDETGSS